MKASSILFHLLLIFFWDNVFDFNNKLFIQNKGTTMGTKMAYSYTNLFMANLEEHFFAGTSFKPTLYLRFIDDMFLNWNRGSHNLNIFVNYLYEFYSSVEFTVERYNSQIAFLDTSLKLVDGKIQT